MTYDRIYRQFPNQTLQRTSDDQNSSFGHCVYVLLCRLRLILMKRSRRNLNRPFRRKTIQNAGHALTGRRFGSRDHIPNTSRCPACSVIWSKVCPPAWTDCHHAASDKSIKGVILHIDRVEIGWGRLNELQSSIADVRLLASRMGQNE